MIALLAFTSLALVTPWFLIVNHRTEGELFQSLIVYHHFHRAFGGAELASHPFWFYGPRLLFDFLPWSPLLLVGLVWHWKQLRTWQSTQEGQLGRYATLAFLVIFIGLSVSRFKRADYLLPLYPWAAIITGLLIGRIGPTGRIGQWLFIATLLAVLKFFPVIVGHYQPVYNAPHRIDQFASRVRSEYPAPKEIVLFRTEAHQLAWHLGKPLRTVVEWHALRSHLGSKGWFLTRAENLDECRQILREYELIISLRSDDFCDVAPHRSYIWVRAKLARRAS